MARHPISELFDIQAFREDVRDFKKRHNLTHADLFLLCGYGQDAMKSSFHNQLVPSAAARPLSFYLVLALANVCDLTLDKYRLTPNLWRSEMTALDDATRCARCHQPGKKTGERPSGNPGNKVLVYHCQNTACAWGSDPDDLGWIVEVLPDGSIPERDATKKEKQFVLPKQKDVDAVAEAAMKAAELYSRPVSDLDNTPETR